MKQGRQCTYTATLRRVRTTIIAVEKQCATYYECAFISLGIQLAMPTHHIVICGLSAVQYFSALSHKRHEFRKISY